MILFPQRKSIWTYGWIPLDISGKISTNASQTVSESKMLNTSQVVFWDPYTLIPKPGKDIPRK